jgi:hypothetical protein
MPTISIDGRHLAIRPSGGEPDLAFHVDEEPTVITRAKPARLQGRKGQP